MRYCTIACLAALVAGLDQISKWAVTARVAPFETIRVTEFFNLVSVRNYGAAFGFLNDPSSTWQLWLFAGATVLATGAVVLVAKQAQPTDKTLFAALGCILGGAFGNLIDRIRLGAVVDFLDLHYAGRHWPAFNVADMAICVGAGLLALLYLRPAPKERQ